MQLGLMMWSPPPGEMEGRTAPSAGNPFKLRSLTARRPNERQKTAKVHDRPRSPRTLGVVERRHVSETRSLYMQLDYM